MQTVTGSSVIWDRSFPFRSVSAWAGALRAILNQRRVFLACYLCFFGKRVTGRVAVSRTDAFASLCWRAAQNTERSSTKWRWAQRHPLSLSVSPSHLLFPFSPLCLVVTPVVLLFAPVVLRQPPSPRPAQLALSRSSSFTLLISCRHLLNAHLKSYLLEIPALF